MMTVYREKSIEGAKTLIGILHKIQMQNNSFKNIALLYNTETKIYEIVEG